MSTAEATPGPQQSITEREPEEIAELAFAIGRERLKRSNLDILITGLIGGVEVSLGGLAAMTVLGAAITAFPHIGLYGGLALAGLIFPIGFLFVIAGRSELFTENFLIPVVAVVRREQPATYLVQVWAFSWIGNIAGCIVMAILISVPHAIGPPILNGYGAYAAYKLSMSPIATLVSAVLAGMIMTILTWLLLAMTHPVTEAIAIWAAGYVIFATNVSHAIVGSSLIFVGFWVAHRPVSEVVLWVALTTVGNLVGGVGLVTAFRAAQVREKRRSN